LTTGSECLQGETLEQQFGEQEVCFRTLDLYTSAVLESTLNPVVPPKEEFRSAMEVMAKVCIYCMMPHIETIWHTCSLLHKRSRDAVPAY